MNKAPNHIPKKDLKRIVNSLGGFVPATIQKHENGFPKKAQDAIRARYNKAQADEILENAVYIKTVSSNGDLNRNGYIIREKAWKYKGDDGKTAIDRYMENPVVLFQHESNEIIGETISAKVTKNGLETEAYIFPDQMSEADQKRFARGQLKGISTGHITLAVEWENAETGEVLDAETAEKEIGFWELLFNPIWLMAVTGLDWVEQSLVTIGSNKKSFVTNNADGSFTVASNQDAKFNFVKNNLGHDMADFERYMELKADPSKGTEAEFTALENKLKTMHKKDAPATAPQVNENGMIEYTLTEDDMKDETNAQKFGSLGVGAGDTVELAPNHPLVANQVEQNNEDEPTEPEAEPTDEPVEPADTTPETEPEPSGEPNTPSDDEVETNGDGDETTPTEPEEPGNGEPTEPTTESTDEPDGNDGTSDADVDQLAAQPREQLEKGAQTLTNSLAMIQQAMAKQDAANANDDEPTEPEASEEPTEPETAPAATVQPMDNSIELIVNQIADQLDENGLADEAVQLRENGAEHLVGLFENLLFTNVTLNERLDKTPVPKRLHFVGEPVKNGKTTVKPHAKAGTFLNAALRGIKT